VLCTSDCLNNTPMTRQHCQMTGGWPPFLWFLGKLSTRSSSHFVKSYHLISTTGGSDFFDTSLPLFNPCHALLNEVEFDAANEGFMESQIPRADTEG